MEQNHKPGIDGPPVSIIPPAADHGQTPVTSLSGEKLFPFVQQSIVSVLASMVLDGGQFFQICFYAFVAFWAAFALMSFRRKKIYSRFDLRLIRYGFIPLCVISFFLTRWIWHLRGY